jgi:hypothetical protein
VDAARIEAWALEIVDRLKAGQPIEDSRVEVKRKWIPPERAARRLAGHANAARGDAILWLVGLDERDPSTPVVGVDAMEYSTWWSQTSAQFVELAPEVRELNVPTDGRTVVALWIETTRAPFVVKNPMRGTPEGGVAETEVPWREGTSVRSATRSDLIRILVPAISMPEAEVSVCELSFELDPRRRSREEQYHLHMTVYLRMRLDGPVLIFPDHDARVEAVVDDELVVLRNVVLDAPSGQTSLLSQTPIAQTSERGAGQLLVHGSGPIAIRASAPPEVGPMNPTGGSVRVRAELEAVEGTRPMIIELSCDSTQDETDEAGVRRARWTMPDADRER